MTKIKGWKFPIEINKTTGKIMTVEDDENVKQSIQIILQTEKFERKQLDSFGSRLNQFVFQEIDPILISDIKKEITDSLRRWEKHIVDLDVYVRRSQEGDNSSIITEITYKSDITGIEEKIIKETNLNEG